jgi:hypothetical protein
LFVPEVLKKFRDELGSFICHEDTLANHEGTNRTLETNVRVGTPTHHRFVLLRY